MGQEITIKFDFANPLFAILAPLDYLHGGMNLDFVWNKKSEAHPCAKLPRPALAPYLRPVGKKNGA